MLLFFFLTGSGLSHHFIENPKIQESVPQGQAIVLTFNLPQNSLWTSSYTVRSEFIRAMAPCNPQPDGSIECLIAVPADAREGRQKIKLFLNGKKIESGGIKVSHTDFPTEPLRLSDEKKSLLSQPDREDEVKLIHKALSTESPIKQWGKDFLSPIQGVVESPYGEKRVLDGKLQKGYHRGVDLASPEGTPIFSSNNGTVILEGKFSEEGNMVMVDHGQGVISAYLHLSEILVAQGQKVHRGEQIGKVGSTGVANTPHLHFGIYIHGTPVNPLWWLKTF